MLENPLQAYLAILVTAVVAGTLVALAYGLHALLSGGAPPQHRPVFLGGGAPAQHAMSRYHVRWYAVAILFLAFDMEMVFMYPWAVVVADIGTMALIEMGMFLLILLLGVLYAWREGALRWS
jgi:NADH-quinone oxidoreductase subunit A